ncbi:hypothetical protein GCK32_013508 [Trichostrongylus colubriformis]|uniref:Uncharacterized protein n=1 Tax=Trichostrongylus colubriformis TaxID=6319 RepID=A0AAN8FWC5_TRICO
MHLGILFILSASQAEVTEMKRKTFDEASTTNVSLQSSEQADSTLNETEIFPAIEALNETETTTSAVNVTTAGPRKAKFICGPSMCICNPCPGMYGGRRATGWAAPQLGPWGTLGPMPNPYVLPVPPGSVYPPPNVEVVPPQPPVVQPIIPPQPPIIVPPVVQPQVVNPLQPQVVNPLNPLQPQVVNPLNPLQPQIVNPLNPLQPQVVNPQPQVVQPPQVVQSPQSAAESMAYLVSCTSSLFSTALPLQALAEMNLGILFIFVTSQATLTELGREIISAESSTTTISSLESENEANSTLNKTEVTAAIEVRKETENATSIKAINETEIASIKAINETQTRPTIEVFNGTEIISGIEVLNETEVAPGFKVVTGPKKAKYFCSPSMCMPCNPCPGMYGGRRAIGLAAPQLGPWGIPGHIPNPYVLPVPPGSVYPPAVHPPPAVVAPAVVPPAVVAPAVVPPAVVQPVAPIVVQPAQPQVVQSVQPQVVNPIVIQPAQPQVVQPVQPQVVQPIVVQSAQPAVAQPAQTGQPIVIQLSRPAAPFSAYG